MALYTFALWIALLALSCSHASKHIFTIPPDVTFPTGFTFPPDTNGPFPTLPPGWNETYPPLAPFPPPEEVLMSAMRCGDSTSTEPCPIDCNLRCPAGYFCPLCIITNNSRKYRMVLRFPCIEGGYCPADTSCVLPVPRGYTINGTTLLPCPKGHFCPAGQLPRKCMGLASCDYEGMGKPDDATLAWGAICVSIIFLVTVEGVYIVSMKWSAFDWRVTQLRERAKEIYQTQMSKIRRRDGETDYLSAGQRQSSDVFESRDTSALKLVPRALMASLSRCDVEFVCNKMEFELFSGKKILSSVTCIVRPRSLTAIMGPSGCGKTTFMNVLSGKAWVNGRVTGSFLLNGQPITPSLIASYKSVTGYVPQDDVMHRQLTVYECLQFNTALRLPKTWSKTDRDTITSFVVYRLGLSKHADTLIGDEQTRGVSGGQRKRVNVGMEMVALPSLLFLDEPTSGLDSTTSMELCDELGHLARRENTTVISVIHQPRYEIFKKFDQVIFLAPGGRVVYAGPTGDAEAHFAQFGYIVPERMNPADYFMDVIAGTAPSLNPSVTLDTLLEAHEARASQEIESREPPKGVSGAVNSIQAAPAPEVMRTSSGVLMEELSTQSPLLQQNSSVILPVNVEDRVIGRTLPSYFMQFIHYTRRSFRLMYLRQCRETFVDFVIAVLGAAVLGFCLPSKDYGNIVMHYSLGEGLLFVLFAHASALRAFAPERAIFHREASTGMSVVAYMMGKDLAYYPVAMFIPWFFGVVHYALVAPRMLFIEYMVTLIVLSYTVFGVGFLISAATSQGTGQMLAVLAAFSFLLLSGYNPSLLTLWEATGNNAVMRVITALSPVRWSLEVFMAAEYRAGSKFWKICAYASMEPAGYEPYDGHFGDNEWPYRLFLLFGLGVLYRIAALLCLKFMERSKMV